MPANYVLLQRQTLTADAASVLLNQIPTSGYTDLKLVISARGTYSGNGIALLIRPNSNTSNTTARVFYGDGSAPATFGDTVVYGNIPAATTTSNTYGVSEFHIFNYSSSNAKSFLGEGYNGGRTTTALTYFTAARWNDSSAISSLLITPSSGNLVAGSEFSIYGLAAVGTTPVISPFATGGDIIVKDSTFYYHTFLSSGTFTPLTNLTCNYLVVAGGGGGGTDGGGGGGAGGLRSTVTATGGGGTIETPLSLSASNNYTVTIGAGGAGAILLTHKGANGSNSAFATITSIGGGGGGSDASAQGSTGGSGGGSRGNRGELSGVAGTANQGFAGGATGSGKDGSGGGGAGGAGQDGQASYGSGNGGIGVAISALASATSTGVSNYYAGGGGAGDGGTSGQMSTGGAGGGGKGGNNDTNVVPDAGTANTGGGGGGGKASASYSGASGGSGIVIVRYPIG